ncbi:hypothetical protein MTP09_06785 [Chryseobacterium suipulveris]|uniref:Uncharacterized protein n=1 Tax=Chryseobacterium suipulveris TaxID=2929800 RepID=A0ABY4BT11_9FLAO|nr:hypothetical protein [Chryseobacterium suipulveris]UOE42335.1 hypothetical protein MTP09_06785 [Chryseobacterium suipulveris]
MKIKLLLTFFLLMGLNCFSQSKVDANKDNLKFYFPIAAFNNSELYKASLPKLIDAMAPYSIDEKNGKYGNDATEVLLLQKIMTEW